MPKIEYTCYTCGVKFLRYASAVKRAKTDRFYCSRRCHLKGEGNPKWQGGIPEKICEICGEKYKPFRRGKATMSRFCSRKCQNIGHSKEISGENHPLWKGGKILVQCKQCGKNMEMWPSQTQNKVYCSIECAKISRGHAKIAICPVCGRQFTKECKQKKQIYCSVECFIKSSKEQRICRTCGKQFITNKCSNKRYCSGRCWGKARIGEKNSHWQGGKITLICTCCGKEFGVPKHRKNISKYCSNKCRAEHYKERFAGEGNSNWTGGKVHYRGKNWEEQKLKALERDEYRCRRCGEEVIRLEVHHIIPFKCYEGYLEANELHNLKVLCAPCHIIEEPSAKEVKMLIILSRLFRVPGILTPKNSDPQVI